MRLSQRILDACDEVLNEAELSACGPEGIRRCREDTRFHVQYLASAVEVASPLAFTDYVRWVCSVLTSRQLDPDLLGASLKGIFGTLSRALPDDAPVLADYLRAGLEACREPAVESLVSAPSVFLQAILRGDRRLATAVAREAVGAGASLCTVYQDVIGGALVELGRLWQTNVISVSAEHLATAVAKYVVAQLYASQPVPTLNGLRAVVTGVQGELHSLGGNMVADVLEAEGWDVSWLGSNLPGPDILREIEERKPDLVAFSVTIPARLPEARQLIRQVPTDQGVVMVGGRAFGCVSEDWCRELGVRHGRSLADALDVAEEIVRRRPRPSAGWEPPPAPGPKLR